jgi:hypothetical protein
MTDRSYPGPRVKFPILTRSPFASRGRPRTLL